MFLTMSFIFLFWMTLSSQCLAASDSIPISQLQTVLKDNVFSLGKSGCVPHLVYFSKSFRELNDIQMFLSVPVQITYVSTFCQLPDIRDRQSCMKSFKQKKSKFVRCISRRFSHPCCCHAFLFLWPEILPKVETIELDLALDYLGHYSRVSSQEFAYSSVLFPVSYIGEMFFILIVDILQVSFSKIRKKSNIPDQTFIYDLRKMLTLGSRSSRWRHRMSFTNLGKQPVVTAGFLTKFLVRKDRVSKIHLFDDDEFIPKGFKSKAIYDLHFGYYDYRPKSLVFCSLIASRMPNITIYGLTGAAEMYQTKKRLLVLRFTTLAERNLLSKRNDEYYTPRGVERLKGALIFRERPVFNFITCAGAAQHLSFDWILTPFDSIAWVVGACIFITLIVIMRVMFPDFHECFSILVWGFLLEQPYVITKKLLLSVSFKQIVGPFMLSTIILTNYYKGIFVTDLTAPRKLSGIISLEELAKRNYTIYTRPKLRDRTLFAYTKVELFGAKYIWTSRAENTAAVRDEIRMPDKNETYSELLDKNWSWRVYFRKFPYSELIFQRAVRDINDKIVETGFLITKNLKVPKGYPHVSIQERIASCDKTAFIDLESSLHRFYRPKYWKNIQPLKQIYHGKDDSSTGLSTIKVIEIFGGFVRIINFLRDDLACLIHSGIYDRWERFMTKSVRNNLFREHLQQPFLRGKYSAVNLKNSQILSVFWIFFSCCGASLVMFLAEIILKLLIEGKRFR